MFVILLLGHQVDDPSSTSLATLCQSSFGVFLTSQPQSAPSFCSPALLTSGSTPCRGDLIKAGALGLLCMSVTVKWVSAAQTSLPDPYIQLLT